MYVFNKSLLDCYITSIKLLRFSFVEKLLVCYIKKQIKSIFYCNLRVSTTIWHKLISNGVYVRYTICIFSLTIKFPPFARDKNWTSQKIKSHTTSTNLLFFLFSSPVEFDSGVSSDIKWFQLSPDRIAGDPIYCCTHKKLLDSLLEY
jgi:hypothetical protein